MKWGPHITKVVKKANKSLSFLRRNLRVQSQRLKERAYKALVRPTLEYASSVWDPHNTEDITKLEAVQRRAARWVVNRHRQTSSVASMLHDLKWPSLQSRRRQARLINFFKFVNGCLVITSSRLPTRSSAPRRSVRRTNPINFNLPQCRCNYRQKSYFPATIRDWNALPAEAALCDSVEAFKSRI